MTAGINLSESGFEPADTIKVEQWLFPEVLISKIPVSPQYLK
jgi:hypothetical protein